MKTSQLWKGVLAASTFSTVVLMAAEAKAMSLFKLDFTTLFPTPTVVSPGDIDGIDLGTVEVDVRGRTRDSNRARNLSFNADGVGIIGSGSPGIDGSRPGRVNDERLRLDFSKSVKFTQIVFSEVDGNDNFTLRVDRERFNDANLPIALSGITLLDTPFGTRFDIDARQNNDNFRIASISGEVIPTPALLPGLVSMGVAVLRKRRNETADIDA